MTIKLVAGLGNPGAEYEGTRHNAGFLALERAARELGANYWKSECGADVAHVKRGGSEVLLAKPMSFMNTSGGPISKLAATYKVKPEEILVVHDDMDLEPGVVRIKVGGGHGGHNGLKSIHVKLGSNGYVRVRVGTGHPKGNKRVVDYVLQVPKGDEAIAFGQAVERAAEAIVDLLDESPTKAMNKYNVK